MSTRIARDSGALLSATDSPVHTGHASSFVEPRRARRRRVARARARDEHDHRDHDDRREREPRHPPPPQAQTPPDRATCEPRLELGVGDRADAAARGDARRRDHVRLGLAGRAEAEPGAAVRVERDRPRDARSRDVAADRRSDRRRARCRPSRSRARCVCARVERLRARAAPAGTGCTTSSRSSRRRSCPRARCALTGLPSSVVRLNVGRRLVLLHEARHRRLGAVLHREHDAERDEHDRDGSARSTGSRCRALTCATSASARGSSVDRRRLGTIAPAPARRREREQRAERHDHAADPQPHHERADLHAERDRAAAARRCVGADTSVRYTSCHGSLCIAGVPMPSGKFGIRRDRGCVRAEVRRAPAQMRTSAAIVVFCARRSVLRAAGT